MPSHSFHPGTSTSKWKGAPSFGCQTLEISVLMTGARPKIRGAMYMRYVAMGTPSDRAWATAALDANTTQIAATAPATPARPLNTRPVVLMLGHCSCPERNRPSGTSTAITK